MSTHRPNLCVILSQTSRVIRAQSGHFLALSALFLFPVAFLTIINPFLLQLNSVIFPVLYAVFVLLFSLCASVSITFTTFHGFHRTPVSFISILKSILVSFFPLLATLLVTQIILALILFASVGLTLLSYNGLLLLGFEIDYDSVYFLVFVILLSALFVVVLVYLQIHWCLSTAVVVVESKWGFAPLNMSSYLVKGMRWTAFLLMILVGILVGLLSFWYSNLVSGINRGSISWGAFVVEMVIYAVFSTLLSLYSVAANTVLFVYCTALHGKMAFEVDEEFGSGYMQLPVDDGVVSAV